PLSKTERVFAAANVAFGVLGMRGAPRAPGEPPPPPPTAPQEPPLNAGAYNATGGHHVHQSGAYSPAGAKSAHGKPTRGPAISIEQGVPGLTEAQHDVASAAQLNINRAYRGSTVNNPVVGDLTIGATGEGHLGATASSWFEDTKAYYALRASGIPVD